MRPDGAPSPAAQSGDDGPVRAAALDPRRSFIVRAPAGSGKTALLIQRLLRLLAVADAPEEIVAITFTRKAAAEMRERLLDALRLAQEKSAPPEKPLDRELWTLGREALAHASERGWSVTDHPNRLRIQTFDAFCHAMARRHPWTSGLGGPLQPAEDPGPLYREAARATLDLLESDEPEAAAVAHLLKHRDVRVEQVEELLVQMLRRRDQWLPHLPAQDDGADGHGWAPGSAAAARLRADLEAALARIVTEALAGLHAEFAAAGNHLQPGSGDGARTLAVRCARLARHASAASPALAEELAAAAALADAPGSAVPDLAPWRALAALLLTDAGEWRKPRGIDVRRGFPPGKPGTPQGDLKSDMQALVGALAGREALRARLAALGRLPSAAYTDSQWETLGALAALLRRAEACLRRVFAAAGVVDFVELAQAADRVAAEWIAASAAAEGGGGDREEDSAIRHLLVDEFQDSSHSQFRLLERLTRNWRTGDGRTLFLVGDPMQSIYRFREADVGLFLMAEDRGVGPVRPEKLQLVRNFRARPGIVEHTNRTFAEVFPRAPDALHGAVTYAPSSAARCAPPAAEGRGAAVRLHPIVVPADADGAADGAKREAELVAGLARAALAELSSERDAAPRASPSAETDGSRGVAILVQARTHLDAILPALARAGVPVQAVKLDPLDRRPAVLDLLSLARALLFPGDRIAWLAVLHAPWCGLGLADLEALALGAGERTLWEALQSAAPDPRRSAAPTQTAGSEAAPGEPPAVPVSAAGIRRIVRLRETLAPALAEAGRVPLRRTVEGAWLALGGPACIAEAEASDVRAFLDVLDAIEAEGAVPSPEEMERRVAELRSAPGAASAPAVQVMTIHEAKGLEFDTVILPGLHRETMRDARPLLRWLERPTAHGNDLILAPIPGAGTLSADAGADPIQAYLDGVEHARADQERRRLLYVACTRARERLHLVGVARSDGARVKPPRPRALLAAPWPAVSDEFDAAGAAPLPAARNAAPGPAPGEGQASSLRPGQAPPPPERGEPPPAAGLAGRRLTADWTLPALGSPGAAVAAEAHAAEAVVFEWAGPEARLVGTVVHALMQRVAQEGLAAWDGAALPGRRETVRRLLIRAGLAGPEPEAASERVMRALGQALADPRGRWALGPHAEARTEWGLTARSGGTLRRIAPDRTFVDESGVRWIVDYKTGSHAGGSLDEFLDRERERYRPQLERYAQALRALDARRPIRCGLYFPLAQAADGAGGWREWEFAG